MVRPEDGVLVGSEACQPQPHERPALEIERLMPELVEHALQGLEVLELGTKQPNVTHRRDALRRLRSAPALDRRAQDRVSSNELLERALEGRLVERTGDQHGGRACLVERRRLQDVELMEGDGKRTV